MSGIKILIALTLLFLMISCTESAVNTDTGNLNGEDINGNNDENGDEENKNYCCVLTIGGLFGDESYTEGNAMVATPDGGYVIAGNTTTYQGDFEGYNYANQSRTFLMKLDQDLNIDWIKTIGGTNGATKPYSLIMAPDGGFVVSGYTGADDGDFSGKLKGNHVVYIWKTDENGNTDWLQTYGGTDWEYGRSISATKDGGYVVTGYSASNNLDFKDLRLARNYIFLLKLDSGGNKEWVRSYSFSEQDMASDYGYFVKQVPDGGYLITGSYQPSNAILFKTDPGGNTEWVKAYSHEGFGSGQYIHLLDDGNLILAGKNILLRASPDGEVIWQSNLGLTIHSLTPAIDSGFVVTGVADRREELFSDFNIFNRHLTVVKFDLEGNIQWKNTIGGDLIEQGNAIVQASDGGYVMTGYGTSNERVFKGMKKGYRHMIVVKTDENGQLIEVDEE